MQKDGVLQMTDLSLFLKLLGCTAGSTARPSPLYKSLRSNREESQREDTSSVSLIRTTLNIPREGNRVENEEYRFEVCKPQSSIEVVKFFEVNQRE